MRNFIFLSFMLFAFCLVLPVSAQNCYVGVLGGLNFAAMDVVGDGEDQKVSSHRVFGAGGVFGIDLNTNFSLQLYPMYLQKGGIMEMGDSDPDIKFNMAFLEMPLFLKAALGKNIRPYVLAGPTFGFLLTSECEAEINALALEADLKDITKKLDVGIGLGGGVEFPLWKGSIFLEGRYTFGLNNLNKGGLITFKADDVIITTHEVNEQDEFKNKGFQIMAGFTLPLGKE